MTAHLFNCYPYFIFFWTCSSSSGVSPPGGQAPEPFPRPASADGDEAPANGVDGGTMEVGGGEEGGGKGRGGEDFFQIAALIEQLRHNDLDYRVNATKHLCTISRALGEERTREELIPFIMDSTDDEDEVLLAMAEALGDLVDCLGGPEHVHQLLVPLEALTACEEGVVRERAVESILKVGTAMSREAKGDHLLPFLRRLADRDWFTTRMSATALFEHVYRWDRGGEAEERTARVRVLGAPARSLHASHARPPSSFSVFHSSPSTSFLLQSISRPFSPFPSDLPADTQQELIELYERLCKDDTPMVRRVAALHLASFVRSIPCPPPSPAASPASPPACSHPLLPSFRSLAADDHDNVRLQTVANCVALAQALPAEARLQEVLPITLAAAADRAWRVRWSVASKFEDVCQAFGPEVTASSICSSFERLLQDPEAEVRTAAAANTPAVAQHLPPALVVSALVPCLKQLVVDGSEHVRAALATGINDFAPLLGKEDTIAHLLPLLLQLLRDASSEVRLNIIAKLQSLNDVIGVELLSQSLLPAIVDLAEDNKWRVRLAIIEHIPALAQQLGPAFFNEKLNGLCMMWLSDGIHSIRLAATQNLKRLTDLFGQEWAQAHILPRVRSMQSHPSHLQRMTALYAIQVSEHCSTYSFSIISPCFVLNVPRRLFRWLWATF